MASKIEIVDTNVWVMLGNIPPDNEIERECVLACIQWGKRFNESGEEYKIAVDMKWKILTEYRNNIREGSLAQQYLNTLLSQPIMRLVFKPIQYDDNDHAIIDVDLDTDDQKFDPSDKKFVAVALAFDDPPPIINATDTDWEKHKVPIEAAGITVHSLCPDYITDKLENK